MAEEEQGGQPSQDPAPETAATAPQQPPAPPEQPAWQPPGPAPWNGDLEQTFQDPQVRAQVDAYLRSNIQPRMTQLEQSNVEARQLYDAYQQDPDAANIAVNRQLYGDQYADQLAASVGRYDQMVTPPQAAPQQQQLPPQQQFQQPQEPQQQPVLSPEREALLARLEEDDAARQYAQAKTDFLKDPQYADINPDLFDQHVQGAETWEDAVASYRNYAAYWAQTNGENVQPPQPPPTIGSQAVGTPGSTAATPVESLDEAIDGIFSEQRPIAPPALGQQ